MQEYGPAMGYTYVVLLSDNFYSLKLNCMVPRGKKKDYPVNRTIRFFQIMLIEDCLRLQMVVSNRLFGLLQDRIRANLTYFLTNFFFFQFGRFGIEKSCC